MRLIIGLSALAALPSCAGMDAVGAIRVACGFADVVVSQSDFEKIGAAFGPDGVAAKFCDFVQSQIAPGDAEADVTESSEKHYVNILLPSQESISVDIR